MITSQRVNLPPAPLPADANIHIQYPIQNGAWILHPDIHPRENSFCRFSLDFEVDAPVDVTLHVSADNRFELVCDGQFVGMGPDRCDTEHWSFHSYRLTLEPGAHTLVADVCYLYENPPFAQISVKPGFVLYAEDTPIDLNTGTAPWRVTRLTGITTAPPPLKGFFAAGPDYRIDGATYFTPPPAVEPAVVRKAGWNKCGGNIMPGWRLHPSRLPEQVRRPVGGGAVRFVGDITADAPFPHEDSVPPATWQSFIEDRSPITVPANERVVVLWDLDQYHTAYPELTVSGGRGGHVRIEWAESCYVATGEEKGKAAHRKENRDEIVGKYFRGNGDTFLPDGPERSFRAFWWRAGRYVRLQIETGDEPMTLQKIVLHESRMPLENESLFACDDNEFAPIVDLSVRGIQMCAHETYMDCPYYEQLMYVGDTRIQMLVAYMMSAEDRLNQRGIELFDWSRRETGFVLERYPSVPRQLSTTFAMIWVLMLRDYAWWRDAPAFVRERIKGLRCLLEEFKAHQGDAGLLPPLPGWSFIDWVDGLDFVNPPGSPWGVASVVNLLLINALNAAAELEDAFGEAHLAKYDRAWAERLAKAVDARFWDERRGLFADDPGFTQYSEHAQCLALLSGRFPQRDKRCFASLISDDDLLRTTCYFSFYLLETFAKFGRGDLIVDKLAFWKAMVKNGFRTPVETPEPSRSDCHAWSSHPLFHMHASLAGIRPATASFSEVRIEPRPGPLTELSSTIPHPKGQVSLAMTKTNDRWDLEVTLPPEVPGTVQWQGKEYNIKDKTKLELPCC